MKFVRGTLLQRPSRNMYAPGYTELKIKFTRAL